MILSRASVNERYLAVLSIGGGLVSVSLLMLPAEKHDIVAFNTTNRRWCLLPTFVVSDSTTSSINTINTVTSAGKFLRRRKLAWIKL